MQASFPGKSRVAAASRFGHAACIRSKGFGNEFAAISPFSTTPLAPSPDICFNCRPICCCKRYRDTGEGVVVHPQAQPASFRVHRERCTKLICALGERYILKRRPRHSAHKLNGHVPYQSREVPGLANIVRLANQYVEVHSTRVHVPLIHPMTGLHCCCCPTAFESMISLGRLHEFERPFQRYSS